MTGLPIDTVLIVGRRRTCAEVLRDLLGSRGISSRLLPPLQAQGSLAAQPPSTLILVPRLSSELDWELTPSQAVKLARRAFEKGVERLILISSTFIYPPSHHHPGYVGEDYRTARPMPGPARCWTEYETRVVEAWADPSRLCVLRAAPLLGRAGQGPFGDLCSSGLAVTPLGYNPVMQFLHPEDLADALLKVLESRRGGTFNIVPGGAIPLRDALSATGSRRLPLPVSVQRPARRLLSRLGLAAHPGWTEYLRHPFMASGDEARRRLGFQPRRTSAQTVFDLIGSPQPAPSYDRFGLDLDYVEAYGRTLLRFLHDFYWRVEESGWENVPRRGRAVLVGVHRGFMPFDGVMLMHGLVQQTGRCPRFLVHPSLVKFPGLANFMTKLGGIPANHANADWVLQKDEILGVYPEGIQGAFTPYRDAYSLGRFGRSDFVRMALRNQAPILPVVTAGSAEIFPILGRVDWKWFRRFTEWPYLPITPTFPLLPLPLPSKWHTRFLPLQQVQKEYGPSAADDPTVVRRISIQVRDRMQEEVQRLLKARRSIWR
ncbi:MAG TPA: 1-acyl-sn-glycerol-3-phosphate acyltransferase [Acidobacteriota bacterium]|nr:1-acyl-sn-glycerol-3-phosphate acyltransferase [Acidobacteriota bacterium]